MEKAPPEQLQIGDCMENDPACTEDFIRRKVQTLVEEHSGIIKDSLRVFIRFRVDSTGQPVRKQIGITKQTRTVRDSLRTLFDQHVNALAPISTSYREEGPYPAWHSFTFEFHKESDTLWQPIDIEKVYKGGIIDEPPMFPDCSRTDFESDVQCFTKRMREHVATHFKYPKEALRNGIEGRAYVSFTIDEKGRVTELRSSGSHPLFEAEGVRIFSKLPRFTPGRRDGIADAFKFSVPVVFKLSN